jgi:hypothetical protein
MPASARSAKGTGQNARSRNMEIDPLQLVTVIGLLIATWIIITDDFESKDNNFVHEGVDYINKVDEVCYSVHNPNSTSNYREGWGSAYRLCMLQNLNINISRS